MADNSKKEDSILRQIGKTVLVILAAVFVLAEANYLSHGKIEKFVYQLIVPAKPGQTYCTQCHKYHYDNTNPHRIHSLPLNPNNNKTIKLPKALDKK